MNTKAPFLPILLILSIFVLGCQDSGSKKMQAVSAEQLKAQILDSPAKTVVVNVWASWCKPCVDEFPEMLAAYKTFDDDEVELILVSVDFEEDLPNAQKFLTEQKVSFQTYRQVGNVETFIAGLTPEWNGAIPATFIYNENGQLADFWVGKASEERFVDHIRAVNN